ncbi:MAG: hypothetical protein Q9160_004248 [Pyrenula sp. 1 TL-2023]
MRIRKIDKKLSSKARDRLGNLFENTWLPELLALITSLASLIVIIGLLAAYDGQDISCWHFPEGITLNAVISTFSTISKGFLAVAVSAGLGQWKWLWFRKEERTLKAFDVLDRSSRGPWGSTQLLFISKFKYEIEEASGSLVIILSLLTDPFVQQVLTYHVESEPRDGINAQLPVAYKYSKGSETVTKSGVSSVRAMMDFSMSGALLRGLSQDAKVITQQVPFVCNSGNCTYEVFPSLGVCSACNNISSALMKSIMHNKFSQVDPAVTEGYTGSLPMSRNLTTYSLPDGNMLYNSDLDDSNREDPSSNPQVSMTAKANFDPAQTHSFRDQSLLFFGLSIIRANYKMITDTQMSGWSETPVTATECALCFCGKQINASVQNGVLREHMQTIPTSRISDSWRSTGAVSDFTDTSFNFSSADALNSGLKGDQASRVLWIPRSDLQIVIKGSPEQTFNVSQVSIDSMQPGFLSLFPADIDETETQGASFGNVVLLVGNTSAVKATSSSARVLWDSSNVTELFETLALSMTNELRRSDDNNEKINGTTEFSITIIQVNWPWMALPIGLVIFGSIFVIISALESHRLRQPIWKDESLPILFHGLDQDSTQSRSNLLRIRDMSRMAEMTKVRFVNDGRKIGLGMF